MTTIQKFTRKQSSNTTFRTKRRLLTSFTTIVAICCLAQLTSASARTVGETPSTAGTIRLSYADVATVASKAGFRSWGLVMAVAIAQAESSRYVNVVNRNPSPPTDDLGLWQINDYYHSNSTGHASGSELYDADHLYNLNLYTASSVEAYNAAAAFAISSSGSSWTQWATFYNFDSTNHYADSNFAGYGAYKSYVADARYWASLADSSVLTGAGDNLKATQGVNVRNNPGGGTTGLPARVAGDVGVVLSGPSALTQVAGLGPWYIWWQIRWSDGEVGWSIENNLSKTGGSAPADLALQSITVTHGTYRPGDPVFIPEFIVKNVGGSASATYTVSFYLSTDTSITATDNYLGTTSSPLPGIAGGSSDSYNTTVVVPSTLASRDYYLGAIINLTDANAGNNTNYDPIAITVSTTQTRVIGLSGNLAFGNVSVGSSAQRTLTISNTGNSILTVSSLSYPAGFSGSFSGTIAANSSRDVTVTFSPGAAAGYGGTITVNSDKTSGTNTISCSGTGSTTSSVKDDFDSDGRTDFIIQDSNGFGYIFYMNGQGDQLSGHWLNYARTFGDWKIVGTGDFNSDGKADIIIQDSSGFGYIFYMNGQGDQLSGHWLNYAKTFGDWKIVGTGDFNSDGKTDIIIQQDGTGLAYIFYMNGQGDQLGGHWLNNAQTFGDWRIAGTGDFNSDGKTDIIIQQASTGLAYIFYMNGQGDQLSGHWLNYAKTFGDWNIVNTGDFNSDGKTDIIIQQASTGLAYIFYMNGQGDQLSGHWLNYARTFGDWKIRP
ncbi:MAG: hypothetical protein QOI49_2429 [Verrucomicrobiota bacterium]|jgi:hypothetical protein